MQLPHITSRPDFMGMLMSSSIRSAQPPLSMKSDASMPAVTQPWDDSPCARSDINEGTPTVNAEAQLWAMTNHSSTVLHSPEGPRFDVACGGQDDLSRQSTKPTLDTLSGKVQAMAMMFAPTSRR